MSRVLLVSNRLPATASLDGAKVTLTRAAGGLATGLGALHDQWNSAWVGWPGDVGAFNSRQQRRLTKLLADGRMVPVYLDQDDVDSYYHQVSNEMLWPVCHSLLDRMRPCPQSWQSFRAVNERFAEVVVETARPGDIIWVNDYHLALLPALLRDRLPHARIGFFLHIPFPPADIFAALPWREEFLRGILGADLVGFHTPEYRAHFVASLSRSLDVRVADSRLLWQGRGVTLGAFPMGVDAERWDAISRSDDTLAQALTIRESAPGTTIIASVDRLDYTKGILHRLQAIERLLATYPELRTRIRVIQATVPSREAIDDYAGHRRSVDELVGKINGEYAAAAGAPIVNVHRPLGEVELAAIYRAADVFMVTPLRDGMNLVAKEFVAARTDNDGVLVLSEFAGAAAQLRTALIVNPFDLDGVARRMVEAIEMSPAERARRMATLRRSVAREDLRWWATSFLAAVEGGFASTLAHRGAGRVGPSHRVAAHGNVVRTGVKAKVT